MGGARITCCFITAVAFALQSFGKGWVIAAAVSVMFSVSEREAEPFMPKDYSPQLSSCS